MARVLVESDMIQFLQSCCFCDKEQTVTPSLPIERIIGMLDNWHLQVFGYYYLRNLLPTEIQQKWGKLFKVHSIQDLRQEYTYRTIQSLFHKYNIRYCPLKGADLCWRVYPASALRSKCDLDILVFPEDCDKALAKLTEAGWKAPYQYRHDHHFPAMSRDGITLELHFHLPHFGDCPPEAIWPELTLLDSVEYQLPLELNLLMLFNHCRHHRWSGGLKLLLDFAYLLKTSSLLDWIRLNGYAKQFQIASPEILFWAFPDFFPTEFMPQTRHDSNASAMLRNLIIFPCDWNTMVPELVMSSGQRFDLTWWRERVKGMSASAIRMKTHNPQGNYSKLFLGYCTVGWQKLFWLWHYRHGSENKFLRKSLLEYEQIEQVLNTKSPQE